MARKTFGVSLNDADENDAWLMEQLNNERSVSDVLRQALWAYYTETPQQQDTDTATQAIVEAIDRQGDKLIAALGKLQFVAGAPVEVEPEPEEEGPIEIDPTSSLTRALSGALGDYEEIEI